MLQDDVEGRGEERKEREGMRKEAFEQRRGRKGGKKPEKKIVSKFNFRKRTQHLCDFISLLFPPCCFYAALAALVLLILGEDEVEERTRERKEEDDEVILANFLFLEELFFLFFLQN